MKKLFSFLAIFVFLLILAPSQVSAHLNETDKNINVLIHLNPDDAPIARDPNSSLYFQVNDATHKFLGSDCDCIFSIWQNQKKIYTGKFFAGTEDDHTASIVPYTFPQKGDYQIEASGTPISPGKFQSFNVTFEVEVTKEVVAEPEASIQPQPQSAQSQPNNSLTQYFLYGILAVGAIVVLMAIIKKSTPKRKKKKS